MWLHMRSARATAGLRVADADLDGQPESSPDTTNRHQRRIRLSPLNSADLALRHT